MSSSHQHLVLSFSFVCSSPTVSPYSLLCCFQVRLLLDDAWVSDMDNSESTKESLFPLLLMLGSQNCADNQNMASESYSRPAVNPKIHVVQCTCFLEGGGLLLLFLRSLRNTEVTVEVCVQKNPNTHKTQTCLLIKFHNLAPTNPDLLYRHLSH